MTIELTESQQLIRRAANNDSDAVSQLMDLHRDRLRRMIAIRLDRRINSRLDASDVVQDVMVKAVAQLPNYLKDHPIPFYPWLRQLAWKQIVESYRVHVVAQRRSVVREIDLQGGLIPPLSDQSTAMLAEVLVAQQSSPSRRLGLEQMKNQVNTALRSISEAYREVLVMRYLEQLSMREIADCLGATESAIKQRHVRALKQLAKELSHSGSSDD